jgi:predicted secreted hydrolase
VHAPPLAPVLGAVLLAALLCASAPGGAVDRAAAAAADHNPPPADFGQRVVPGMRLQFPRDYGSHPQFGIEWWYVTGWLETGQRQPLGFQITFFRVRRQLDAPNPSAFAPDQILIAHVAISDPQRGRLWQAQRIRRAGLGLVQAAEADTQVDMDDWRLRRHVEGARSIYEASVTADDFALQLTLTDAAAPLLNGQQGFSQKGPALRSASYYYSEPHLQVRGSVVRGGRRDGVSGEAWLDHEWASEYLDPAAEGWDWVGLNLANGGALMAFEIRDREGRDYWGGGTLRDAQGHVREFAASQVQFTPLERWRSPRSGVDYPVAELVRAGPQRLLLEPLMDDQEFDARQSSGAYYWEGAVSARSPSATASVGRGYLELTGYDRPLSLR